MWGRDAKALKFVKIDDVHIIQTHHYLPMHQGFTQGCSRVNPTLVSSSVSTTSLEFVEALAAEVIHDTPQTDSEDNQDMHEFFFTALSEWNRTAQRKRMPPR
jgi:hypothetical protein